MMSGRDDWFGADRDAFIASLFKAGVVDTHYHVGPELIDRRYDVATLAEAARGHNMTLVLKNHTYPTTPLAALARSRFGARCLGSVVLNRFVGGLNPDAVRGAASGNRGQVRGASEDPTFIVYMPTVHAASHLRVLGHAFDQRWSCGHDAQAHIGTGIAEPVRVFDEALRPLPALDAVLEAIVETGATLATGHLAAEEIMQLVPRALAVGVRAVLLTHPHYPSVALSDDQLIALAADSRVFIEHCFAIHTIEDVPLDHFARSIIATGPRQCVLSTDFGQIHSDPIPEGTIRFVTAMAELLKTAMTREEFAAMLTTNSARALGLTEDHAA